MSFENEFTGILTLLQLLVLVLFGVAPIAVTIAIKLVLYRRRLAEDEALRDEVRKVPRGENTERELPRRRTARARPRTRLVRPLPRTFNANRPLSLFVTKRRGEPARHLQNN